MNILLNNYIKGSISAEERKRLKKWVLKSDANKALFKKKLLAYDAECAHDFDVEAAFERFSQATIQRQSTSNVFKRQTFYKYAAVFVGLVALGFFAKYSFSEAISAPETQVATTAPNEKVDDITIKLADGSTQILNDEEDAAIVDAQGRQVASKKKQTLRFEKSNASATKLVYNEIQIPNGKTLKLELSDGSIVWLNSGSHFKFPQQFIAAKDQRKVFLTGEAFFDIAKDKSHPFIVDAGEMDITVLGTQFNVSAYDTNKAVATTLVEGSVSINTDVAPETTNILVPNQQLRYDVKAKSITKEMVDTKIYTAWMQGKLIINSLSFDDILRKLERRDDMIIINNATNLNDEIFKGEFTNEAVEEILKIMALSTPFEYSINDNTITISNK